MCRQLIDRYLKMEDSVAAFLIIKANYSYYSASTGWFDADWVWHPEYDALYGDPLGPAVTSADGMVYTRSFTGCEVSVNCSGVNGHNCHGNITLKGGGASALL
jgi:hypothetical protein